MSSLTSELLLRVNLIAVVGGKAGRVVTDVQPLRVHAPAGETHLLPALVDALDSRSVGKRQILENVHETVVVDVINGNRRFRFFSVHDVEEQRKMIERSVYNRLLSRKVRMCD